MNLIFIYGPPASGKLTIGEELATLTGYTLFHNHHTRNLVHDLEQLDNKDELVERLRLEVFRFAAQQGTNLIFTFVHDGLEDDDMFMRTVVDIISANNGHVHFVETHAPNHILLERIGNESRIHHRKLTDATIMESRLADGDFGSSKLDASILHIDTSERTAKSAAEAIVREYNL